MSEPLNSDRLHEIIDDFDDIGMCCVDDSEAVAMATEVLDLRRQCEVMTMRAGDTESDLRSARATALEQETRAQNAEMALATLRTRLAGSVHHSDLRSLARSWGLHCAGWECAAELSLLCETLAGDEKRAGEREGGGE